MFDELELESLIAYLAEVHPPEPEIDPFLAGPQSSSFHQVLNLNSAADGNPQTVPGVAVVEENGPSPMLEDQITPASVPKPEPRKTDILVAAGPFSIEGASASHAISGKKRRISELTEVPAIGSPRTKKGAPKHGSSPKQHHISSVQRDWGLSTERAGRCILEGKRKVGSDVPTIEPDRSNQDDTTANGNGTVHRFVNGSHLDEHSLAQTGALQPVATNQAVFSVANLPFSRQKKLSMAEKRRQREKFAARALRSRRETEVQKLGDLNGSDLAEDPAPGISSATPRLEKECTPRMASVSALDRARTQHMLSQFPVFQTVPSEKYDSKAQLPTPLTPAANASAFGADAGSPRLASDSRLHTLTQSANEIMTDSTAPKGQRLSPSSAINGRPEESAIARKDLKLSALKPTPNLENETLDLRRQTAERSDEVALTRSVSAPATNDQTRAQIAIITASMGLRVPINRSSAPAEELFFGPSTTELEPANTLDPNLTMQLSSGMSTPAEGNHADPPISVNEPETGRVPEPSSSAQGATAVEREVLGYAMIEIMNPVECDHCGKLFINNEAVAEHLRKENSKNQEKGTWECQYCKMQLKNDANHIRHIIMVHLGEAKHKCESCGANFSTMRSYTLHRRDQHGIAPQSMRNGNRGGHGQNGAGGNQRSVTQGVKTLMLYRCSSCGYETSAKGNMNRHIRIQHAKLRPFRCETCGSCFPTRHNLQIHRNQHKYPKQRD